MNLKIILSLGLTDMIKIGKIMYYFKIKKKNDKIIF